MVGLASGHVHEANDLDIAIRSEMMALGLERKCLDDRLLQGIETSFSLFSVFSQTFQLPYYHGFVNNRDIAGHAWIEISF